MQERTRAGESAPENSPEDARKCEREREQENRRWRTRRRMRGGWLTASDDARWLVDFVGGKKLVLKADEVARLGGCAAAGRWRRRLCDWEDVRRLVDDVEGCATGKLGGPDKVAEMTGRRGMLVRAATGKGVTYQARNTKDVTMEMVNMHEKQLFMEGKKLVAIISEAGSAGVSLQADRRASNQKRRVHLTLELPWSADRAIQQFGRTHRSNQASAPEYRILFTNLGGERRFASIVAKRLESLGALTQGDRRAGPSLSAYNYDSAYGKKALMVMYKGIMEQDSLPVVPPGCSSDRPDAIQDFIVQAKAALVSVGIVRDTVLGNGKDLGRLSGRIIDSDMHEVGRFLNRILGLPPDIQNGLFELFVSILDLLVRNARIEGNLDTGIVDLKANVIELQGTPKTVHVDQLTGASTVLFTFILDRGITWELASTMLNEKQKDGLGSTNDGFYESKREWLGRRHFILAFEREAKKTRSSRVPVAVAVACLAVAVACLAVAVACLAVAVTSRVPVPVAVAGLSRVTGECLLRRVAVSPLYRCRCRRRLSLSRPSSRLVTVSPSRRCFSSSRCCFSPSRPRWRRVVVGCCRSPLSQALSSASGMYKIVRPPVGESNREMPLSELKSKYRKISSIEKAQSGWEEEYEVSSKQCMHGPNCKIGNFCTVGRRLQEVNILGGLILPVWGAVEKALAKQARLSHRRLRVVRIETTVDTQRIVGLLVPNAAVETVLQGLAWVQEIDD
ncbi:hypothetical protein VNO78_07381 [Psophocarpus tetragonolobus]|uniref:Strawberry notch helicase C domain-containing protein n=1 Tax=Psophocarpus tetragonolobus TaxID=3891 RepID=A0AAN9XRM6_PSOTE